jgi:hypothetical protein
MRRLGSRDPACDRCGEPVKSNESVIFMSLHAQRPDDASSPLVIEHGVWHGECPRLPVQPWLARRSA